MPANLPNPGTSRPPPQWLVRLLSAVLAIGVLIIAVFLGGVILVTGAVLGLGLWGWLWWQRRKMVKMMGEQGGLGGQPGQPGAQAWGPQGFRRPGAGGNAPPGGGQASGRPASQDEQIIEGDFEVLDDNDPQNRRGR